MTYSSSAKQGSNNSHYNDYLKEKVGKFIAKYTNKYTGKIVFRVQYRDGKISMSTTVDDLKEAQLIVDKYLILKGKEPIYILKKKI